MTENVTKLMALMGLPEIIPPWYGSPREIRGKIVVFGFPERVQILSLFKLRGCQMAQVKSLGVLAGLPFMIPLSSIQDLTICY